MLIAVLQQALKACPALPGTAVERSVEDCLRHPSPSATWSLSAVPMFVRDVLSLVTHSPRALGPSVIPLLLRFVSETCCQLGETLCRTCVVRVLFGGVFGLCLKFLLFPCCERNSLRCLVREGDDHFRSLKKKIQVFCGECGRCSQ